MKDPAAPITRFLGVNHEFKTLKDGSLQIRTEAKSYLLSAVNEYMSEIGVKTLSWVPTPTLEDKFYSEHAKEGIQAKTALSHLMRIMYIGRLRRGDVLVTTTFLAWRVKWWSLNQDKRLRRLMSYIFHHADLCLMHELNPADREGTFLEYSPDAELGGIPTPPRRQVDTGWSFPRLAAKGSGQYPSGLKRLATPAVPQQTQKLGAW